MSGSSSKMLNLHEFRDFDASQRCIRKFVTFKYSSKWFIKMIACYVLTFFDLIWLLDGSMMVYVKHI